jgi:flagellar hook-associated protein 1 FlgK
LGGAGGLGGCGTFYGSEDETVPSSFFGLEIARRALEVSQLNLQVIAHNVANADTPGYSRQRAELAATPPFAYPSFQRPATVQQLGSGVEVTEVKSIRDEFLDAVIRAQTSAQGRNTAANDALSQIESTFNEVSDTGLSTAIDRFFAAWQDLSNNPELASARASLREEGYTLVRTVNALYSSLKQLQDDQNEQLQLKVIEANDLAHRIAGLNVQISNVKALGDSPNDLLDQRDLLVEQLAGLVPASLSEDSAGIQSVLINGLRFVEEDRVNELRLVQGQDNPMFSTITIGQRLVPDLGGMGEIGGLMEIRDKTIPFFQDRLDNLTSALINRVNVIHLSGFGLDGVKGRSFFTDYRTAEMTGTAILPVGTTEETHIDQLGIRAGVFEIQGAAITISDTDVKPGEAITLGDLLKRITSSQAFVRAVLVTNSIGEASVRLNLYNPPNADTSITTFRGSTNFLDVVSLSDAETHFLDAANTYTSASDLMEMSLSIRENLDSIAAAGDDGFGYYPGPGNGDNALSIASLQSKPDAIGDSSLQDYYSALIGELGSQARSASQFVTNQSILLDQLSTQRESIRGVSLDEEATKMIVYQRIFEGAARVTQVVDSMLDTLINRTAA